MISRWLERGLGSIVAPDEKFAAKEPAEELTSFWQMVAPDPVYEEKVKQENPSTPAPAPASASCVPAPPPDAFLSPGFKIECVNCKQMTPVKFTPQKDEFSTPAPAGQPQPLSLQDTNDVHQRVLSAAKGYAESMNSPAPVVDGQNKIFRLCASSKPLQERLCNKLEKSLGKDKSLLSSRSVKLGQVVPDGLTPLMAAAFAGNKSATDIILNMDDKGHLDRDLQGRTALHIAAEEGHTEVAGVLMERHKSDLVQPDALVDMVGRTPMGRLLTSPNPKAKKNLAQLEKMLFSPEDISVFGSPPPRQARETIHRSLDMVFGEAEAPGYRVINEDTICKKDWHDEETGEFYCLLGVCDGHGDQRQVSDFVAKEVASRIQMKTKKLCKDASDSDWQTIWTETCLEIDSSLKTTGRAGGSTMVMALVTSSRIIVANVGDSRCILVQAQASEALPQHAEVPALVAEEEPLASQEKEAQSTDDAGADKVPDAAAAPAGTKNTPAEAETAVREESVETEADNKGMATQVVLLGGGGFTVVPLSEDHKPNLKAEKERIEKAGMTVIEETFMDNGVPVTIHKVKKNNSSVMAVSRSFGDFEYKSNKELGPEEQAIVAIPEVRVHSRDAEMDLFLVCACDGVYDFLSSFDVAKYITDQEAATSKENCIGGGRLAAIGDALCRECLNKGSRDNLSVAIAALNQSMNKFAVGTAAIKGKALKFSSP